MSHTEHNISSGDVARVLVTAYLPALFYCIGQGAIIPVLPSIAQGLGASLAFAGFIAGSMILGQLLGNGPAGQFVARVGERPAMLASTVIGALGVLTSVLAPHAVVLLIGNLIIGVSASTFNLARHAYLTVNIPYAYRARALSTLGGVIRAGMLIGPFATALLLQVAPDPQNVYWIFTVCLVLAAASLIFTPRLPGEQTFGDLRRRARGRDDSNAPTDERVTLLQVYRRYGRTLWTLGLASAMLSMLRGARQVLLPLWAVAVGFDNAHAATIFGIAAAVDFALFFVSGWIMDRFGRAACAIPAAAGMGLCYLMLGISWFAAARDTWFITITICVALANGIASGIVMTLSADTAPKEAMSQYLGAWRIITDSGLASVTLFIGALSSALTVAAPALLFGVMGIAGSVMFWRWIPKYAPGPESAPDNGGKIETRQSEK